MIKIFPIGYQTFLLVLEIKRLRIEDREKKEKKKG
jgi:hypothetical protein